MAGLVIPAYLVILPIQAFQALVVFLVGRVIPAYLANLALAVYQVGRAIQAFQAIAVLQAGRVILVYLVIQVYLASVA